MHSVPPESTEHSPERETITRLLRAAGDGDREALDAVFAAVYDELQRLARRVRRSSAQATLSTTALVHEAYLKFVGARAVDFAGREHFFRVVARAMRQVLVNAAQAHLAQKRGGGDFAVSFDEGAHAAPLRAAELVALDEALERLRVLDPRAAEVVEYRFFGGLSVEETAAALALSTPTVKRDWRAARAWLLREIDPDAAVDA